MPQAPCCAPTGACCYAGKHTSCKQAARVCMHHRSSMSHHCCRTWMALTQQATSIAVVFVFLLCIRFKGLVIRNRQTAGKRRTRISRRHSKQQQTVPSRAKTPNAMHAREEVHTGGSLHHTLAQAAATQCIHPGHTCSRGQQCNLISRGLVTPM